MPASRFTCPSCATSLKLAAAPPAGKKIKCPKCGTSFPVPADGAADPAAAPPKTAPAAKAPPPEPPKPVPPTDDLDPVDDPHGEKAPPRKPRRDGADAGDEGRPSERRHDAEEPEEVAGEGPRKQPQKKSKAGLIIGLVAGGAGVLLLCCCGVGVGGFFLKGTTGTSKQGETGGAGAEAGGPKPEAKLPAAELYKNVDAYKGKWVVVIARVPRIHRRSFPDGREEASVDLQGDDGRVDCSADFESNEWAKVPKLEDGVRYEILG